MEKIISRLLEKRITLLSFAGAFSGLLAFRVFIEHFLALASPASPYEIIIEYIHDLYFFSLSFLLLWIFISLLTKTNPREFSGLFLWGSLLTVLPPLLDMLLTKGAVFWSFYVLGSPQDIAKNFLTFFSSLPSGIVYFGTKIVFFLAITAIAVFIFVKTKSYLKTLLGAVGSYAILFFMGAFPTFFFLGYTFFSGGKSPGDVRAYNIAQFFGSPQKIFGVDPQVLKYTFVYNLDFIFFPFLILLLLVIFFMISRKKFTAIIKNLRFPQIIYHSGLFFIGAGLGYLGYTQNFSLNLFSLLAVFTMLLCVWLSWVASVILNDIYDLEIDNISNSERPLPQKIFSLKEYAHLGIFCFILAILGALSIGYSFAALLLAYQFLAWLYSGPLFRLKKFPLVATFTSSLASLMILFAGYILLSSGQTIHTLSWRIILLLMISYTISLPIKDFKDIAGDKVGAVWTLPVIFGEKKARLIVAASIFISYILSVFFLNELDLFFWAILFGSLTFLVVTNEKINPRRLPAWVLGIVSVYMFILVRVVFL